MYRISGVREAGPLSAGLELLEAAAPGAMNRNGRDFHHYWSLVQKNAESVWCAEDREGVVGIFLGTPHPNRMTYYDVVVSPHVDAYPVVADLVHAGAAAAHERGQVRLMSHDPLDGAEFYQSMGHTPTMRVQVGGDERWDRRRALVRAMSDYRLLDLDEDATWNWAAAHFRIDQVDIGLRAQLSDPAAQQYAMHMMHAWADPGDRPTYVVSGYPRFVRTNIAELRQVDPGVTKVSQLHDDTTELRAGKPGHDLVRAARAEPVTFAHSIVPVDLEVVLAGGVGDVDLIVVAARRLPLTSGRSFAVECRKGRDSIGGRHPITAYTTRDVEIRVGTALFDAQSLPIDLAAPEQIVSVYLEGGRALLGLTHPPYADQHRRRASQATLISRAEHKLAEALDVFGVPLPAGGRAMDLGAAPGGWSYLLAERGLTVYAVDPGNLHPQVAAHPRVVHLRARAETLDLGGTRVGVLVNDTNLDPVDSAQLMCAVAEQLRPGGYAIMTIKLPSTRPGPGIASAHAALAKAYDVLATRHLPHNRQEVTTLLRRSRQRAVR
ncbi:SAM-dependent methyltransferase [Actinopolymorpha sp. B17G11]|uniref:SAM-dependent methyltransferase n=1 Tax=Actinopolymorpha sp. B17G11 TaxID=3160861 RepID=UPI0032E3FB9D